jgi:hypothetical protein
MPPCRDLTHLFALNVAINQGHGFGVEISTIRTDQLLCRSRSKSVVRFSPWYLVLRKVGSRWFRFTALRRETLF